MNYFNSRGKRIYADVYESIFMSEVDEAHLSFGAIVAKCPSERLVTYRYIMVIQVHEKQILCLRNNRKPLIPKSRYRRSYQEKRNKAFGSILG